MTRTRLAYLVTAVILLFGLLSFFNPWFMVRVLGFELLEGRGLSEMRATYGAMFLVMSGVLLWALSTRSGAAYLRFAGFLWFGIAAGRLVSMIIDGALLPFNFLALAIELFIGVPLLLAGFQTPTRKKVLTTDPSPLDAYRS